MNEFDMIDQYFKQKSISRPDVLLGIGDDCALLNVPEKHNLAVSMDTLIAGVHFPESTNAYHVAYKAVAVNLSDLAAMGAEPAWMTLALTLPQADCVWLDEFSRGLFELANQYQMQLIGGDTTRGKLSITLQVHGFIPEGKALTRSGAKIGDKIYVSGTLGDAGLGLAISNNTRTVRSEDEIFLLDRFNKPKPQIELGLLLRNIATSAIDISDGLYADLSHLLTMSQVGATITAAKLPLSNQLVRNTSLDEAMTFALTAGDDYELCFTVPAEKENQLHNALKKINIHCHCIGTITSERGLIIPEYTKPLDRTGFKHF